MKRLELGSKIEHAWSMLKRFVVQHEKLLHSSAAHFGAGAIAVAVAICSTQTAVMTAKSSAKVTGKDTAAPQSTSQTTTHAPDKTVYATESWWKAGIGEYDLIEYTNTNTAMGTSAPQQQVAEEPFPEISFSVPKPDGKGTVAQAVITEHGSYPTRSIKGEYYTVKLVNSGAVVSGDGFDMVCKILYGEMSNLFCDEAMRAQAVAIYTYLRYCDANGMVPVVAVRESYPEKVKNIVRSVEGQTITYNGQMVNAVFCASTAGNTTASSTVWGGSMPYLNGVTSEYDHLDPNYGVERRFSASELKRIIQSRTDIRLSNSDVENWFEIVSCTNGKYVGDIKIGGKTHARVGNRTVKLTGAVLRASILGNNTLSSTAFDISYSNGVFTFTTYGYGHGVGMSQWGAHLLATRGGLKYDQILRYYYSGTKISCSGVNAQAVDRFGKDEDISGMEEAIPGELPQENELPDELPVVDQSVTVTTAPVTTTQTQSTTQSQTAPSVTTVPEVTSPEVSEPTVSQEETEALTSVSSVSE